jgi:dienelactone hydrolase
MKQATLRRREVLALGGLAAMSPISFGNTQSRTPSAVPRANDRRRELYALLGDLPDRNRPITSKKLDQAERDGYVLETWQLDLNGIEPVPAYLARPKAATGRRPAVLFNHSHGGGYKIGKLEFVDGRSYLQPVPYAKALTDLGYVSLAIDHWVFGERSHTTEADTVKAMLWQGQVLWGMMVYDSLRATDFLVQRADVDASRLATLGISMGSTMAWWLAALDERIKVTVDICCLTDFHTLLAKKWLAGHGFYYYVPGLLKKFTTAQINALIAPRAHLALAGLQDKLTPVEGLDIIERELTRVYAKYPERWKLLRYDVGHMETPEGRQEIIAFMQRFL